MLPITGEILCTNYQDGSPQTCLQVKGIHSIPQPRLSSQGILSCGKCLTSIGANPTYTVKFLGSKGQEQKCPFSDVSRPDNGGMVRGSWTSSEQTSYGFKSPSSWALDLQSKTNHSGISVLGLLSCEVGVRLSS